VALDPVPGAAGQSYQERLPAPLLTSHVATVWVQRIPDHAAPYTHRTVPHVGVHDHTPSWLPLLQARASRRGGAAQDGRFVQDAR
jgi:hypothetical protein